VADRVAACCDLEVDVLGDRLQAEFTEEDEWGWATGAVVGAQAAGRAGAVAFLAQFLGCGVVA
jgi:hypothetical protein